MRPWATLASLLSLCVLAQSALAPVPVCADEAAVAQAGQPDVAAQAAERFQRGYELFESGDFSLALIEFERAYALSPNYRALYNIGLVQLQLARYARATRAFEQYLHDGGPAITEERRVEVNTFLTQLRLRTAVIELVPHTPEVTVTLDGKALPADALPELQLVDAGEHRIDLTASGYEPRTVSLTLAGQDRVKVELALEPLATLAPERAPDPPELVRRPFWPGIYVTAGLLAGTVVTGVLTQQKRAELSDLKSDASSTNGEREDAARRANALAVTSDVLGALTIVTAGVSLYLSLRKRPAETRPTLEIHARGLALRGKF